MKTNVLLLDSYINIDNLLSVAFSLTKKMGATLKIIYVFDFAWMRQSYMSGTIGSANPSLIAIEGAARKEYDLADERIKEAIQNTLSNESAQVQHEIKVSEFNRIDIVNQEWEKNNNMLLLLSSHLSYTEASGGLIGYPDILSHVKCPVLVLPEKLKSFNWGKIVYATDYNPADAKAIKYLTECAGEGSKLTIVHVAKELDFTGQQLWLGFRAIIQEQVGKGRVHFELVKNKNVEEGLNEFITAHNPDVVAVLKEKRGFFKELFETSETKYVLLKFNKPTFVFHE